MLPPERDYLPINRYDLQSLADLRGDEARLLLYNGYYSGAYYILGYAVECALKACIARQSAEFDFPDMERARDSHNHDFRRMVVTAGLTDDFLIEHRSSGRFRNNWDTVMRWRTNSRYRHSTTEAEATEMFDAVTGGNGGILPWIKARW